MRKPGLSRSEACCDRLFSSLTPLRHRARPIESCEGLRKINKDCEEVTEIIAEEDRVNFSARIMYLSIGKFNAWEAQWRSSSL